MSAESDDSTDGERRAREATAWFVRLKEPDATAEERHAFRLWLAADRAHRDAFDDVQRLWMKLETPAAILGQSGWHRAELARAFRPSRRRTGKIAAALAACLAIVVAAAVWRDMGLLDRVRADYATRPGERRDVSLADGSRVYLDGDTAITARLEATGRSIGLLRGRAWFDVARNEQAPFVVRAGDVETRVIGTAFAVDKEAGDISITVERGLVSVARPSAAAARVSAGRQVRVTDGQMGNPTEIESETALAWRRGLIILDQAPLGRVVDELARMQPGRVMITDASLRQLKLSGVFRADDPDAVVEALHSALGLKTLSVPGLATLVYR